MRFNTLSPKFQLPFLPVSQISNLKSQILPIAYCLLLSGCITPIEFVNDNNEGNLAVFGELSQDSGIKQIRITRTTGFKNGIHHVSNHLFVLQIMDVLCNLYIHLEIMLICASLITESGGRRVPSIKIRLIVTVFRASPTAPSFASCAERAKSKVEIISNRHCIKLSLL